MTLHNTSAAAVDNDHIPQSAPVPTRFESAFVRRPDVAEAPAGDRSVEVYDLLAQHTRVIEEGDYLAAVRIASAIASLALGGAKVTPRALSLVVGPGASAFRLGNGRPVDLRRRRSLRLVLDVLVQARIANPGVAVSATTLIAGGWPGETIRPTSAMSRLYVTILALRKLGLRDIIFAQDGGYLIDPSLELTQAVDVRFPERRLQSTPPASER